MEIHGFYNAEIKCINFFFCLVAAAASWFSYPMPVDAFHSADIVLRKSQLAIAGCRVWLRADWKIEMTFNEQWTTTTAISGSSFMEMFGTSGIFFVLGLQRDT